MKTFYISLLLIVISFGISLKSEAVNHVAYLGVLKVKNKELLTIIDQIIRHEQQCAYYTPKLIFSIDFRKLDESIVEVQIGAIGSILTKLDLDGRCFEYAGHLFLVEGNENSIFTTTNKKRQVSYCIESDGIIINYDDDTYSFWIYNYVNNDFIFKEMHDTYCNPDEYESE